MGLMDGFWLRLGWVLAEVAFWGALLAVVGLLALFAVWLEGRR